MEMLTNGRYAACHGPARNEAATYWRSLATQFCDHGIGVCIMAYSVGFRIGNRSQHIVVEADDALIAALKVKLEKPEAAITYVRRKNMRGDERNPAEKLAKSRP